MAADLEKQAPAVIGSSREESERGSEKLEPVIVDDDAAGGKNNKQKNNEGFGAYLRIFRYSSRQDVLLFALAFACSIAAGATLPLMTLVFGQFTAKFNNFAAGRTSPAGFRSDVDNFTLWFVYLFIGRFVTSYVANLSVSVAALRTTRAIRKRFLDAILRQEVWYFDDTSKGSISSQVTTNGNRINQGIAEKLATTVQGLSLFFSAFIVALSVQWKLSLIVMSVIPAIFLVVGGCIATDAPVEAKITRIYSRASVVAQDAISSIKTVHAFWAYDKICAKYLEHLDEAHDVGWIKSPIYATLFSTQYFLILSATALAFWQGFRMFLSGEIESVGPVLTVVLSAAIGATAMSSIAPQIQSITNASSAAAELFAIIDKKSELDPLSDEGIKPESFQGDIQIRNLDFAYPSRPSAPVLQGINLSIPAGKTTALVGASGCGKSTVVGLLERWYQPQAGQILVDGTEISEYNTKWLRSNIRLVQQEPVLFRGTIFQNVAKGLVGDQRSLSREKQLELVQQACKASNAHDFVMEFQNGYDTEVGERASMLSGGQRQRIAIARSIVGDPTVLLLDEATSALDPRAEGIVQDALNKVSKGKTTLVIAHKLATVKAADNIAVISGGQVVEQGSHAELLARNGRYASFVRLQDLGSASNEQDREKGEPEEQLERSTTLETKTGGMTTKIDEITDDLTAGTLGHSLIKCIFLMLMEHPNLYKRFVVSAFCCVIGGATFPAQAILYSRLINVFLLPSAEAQDEADFFSLMFFVVALANLAAYAVIGWNCNVIGQTVVKGYRLEMLSRMVRLDQDFFDRPQHTSGALTSKLTTAPNALLEMMAANLMLILVVIINVTTSSIVALAFGWKLGLVVIFGGLPFLLLSGHAKIRLDQKLEKQTDERFAESAGLATEAVTSIRTVASLTMEQSISDEYTDTLDGIVKTSISSFVVMMIGYALSQSIEFLCMALGFWYGSRLIATGEYTVQQFFVIFTAVVFGGQAAGQFFGYSTSLTKARGAANYILWLRTLKGDIREDEDNKDIGPDGDGDIDVEQLEFRYKQREAAKVLRGIDMNVKAGSYVACVGPSGCGKSTLISLLERFYDPTAGRITLNSRPITTLNPRLYRAHMSLVQQEPTLYMGSVRDNIALGLAQPPTPAALEAACRAAHAWDFVSSLPAGLATPCGSKGLALSGGQRQRIALARALIRNPRVLLLDEATSALDTHSERVVQRALDAAASDRTTFAVAHRLSTIRHADVIYVFAHGRVAEQGTHEELLRLRGRYFEMCEAQSLDRA